MSFMLIFLLQIQFGKYISKVIIISFFKFFFVDSFLVDLEEYMKKYNFEVYEDNCDYKLPELL